MKINNNISFFKKILKKIRFIKIYVLLVIFLFILVSLQPIFISQFIKIRNILYIFLLFISLLSNEILDFYSNYVFQKLRNYSKEIMWSEIINKNYSEFLSLSLGEVQNLIQESSFLVRNIFDIILVLFKNFLMLVVYFIFLFNINYFFGIVYIVFYLFYIYISYLILKNKSKEITEAIDSTSNINI